MRVRNRFFRCTSALGALLALACLQVRAGNLPAEMSLAGSWQRTDQLDVKQWLQSYRLVGTLHEGGRASGPACRTHAAELDAALTGNPASMALWITAADCAAALGETARADQADAHLLAMVRRGLDSRSVGDDDAAIRVGMPMDAFMLVGRTGEEMEYAWYDVFTHTQFVPLHVVLWNPQTQHERWLSFDFSETAANIAEPKSARYPAVRVRLARDLLKLTAQDPGSIAAGAMQAIDARDGSKDVPSLVARLSPLAQQGHYEAAYALGTLCLAARQPGCAKQAIDALLPWAGKHAAQPMLFLASAYAHGDGVKADRKAALLLLDAADKRLGDGRGLLWYARQLMHANQPGLIDADVLARIRQQADNGHLRAQLYLVQRSMTAHPRQVPSLPEHDVLERASAHGYTMAMRLYADSLYAQKRPVEAYAWGMKAAVAGDPQAEYAVANDLRQGLGVTRDPVQAMVWYEHAARQGNHSAIDFLGYWHQYVDTAPDHLKVAQSWLQSGVVVNDASSLTRLAMLYITAGPGLDHDAAHGWQLLHVLAAQSDGRDARRQLAFLQIEGTRVKRNLGAATTLLEGDAAAGDTDAQRDLGELLLRADNPSRQPARGLELLQAAAAKNDLVAMTALGEAYQTGSGGRSDMVRAMSLWRQAAEDGEMRANNDMAWFLCTSRNHAKLDVDAGMTYAHRLETQERLDPAARDTVAACYAAQGHFDQAIAIEQRALDDLLTLAPRNPQVVSVFRGRVAQYRRHVAYVDHPQTSRH
jgi:TPR repeat protein